MDEWVLTALKRWPNVPALFGWLALDRRGRWLIQGELISHPRIIDVINRNYAADEQGRWYFQNGPQRGYMQLHATPLILFVAESGEQLVTHTGRDVERISAGYMDAEGALTLLTEHGPGELYGADLQWALDRLTLDGKAIDDDALATALERPSGSDTGILFSNGAAELPLRRLDFDDAPAALGFNRTPEPRAGEKAATKVMD